MVSYTREDLLALTPAIYCATGYAAPDGSVRPAFRSEFATAASTQCLAGEVSPQELSLTAEAVRQILPLHDGAPGQRAREAADEALAVVAHAIRQPSNEVLAQWLKTCAAAVRTEADLSGFLVHLQAVERLYAVVAPLSQQPSPPDSSPAPS